MRLIIAEKPSMGRSIAHALGIRGGGSRNYIEGKDAIVTWAVGHLVELCYPEAYDPALKQWSWDTLPILPERFKVQPVRSSRAQLDVVLGLIKRADVTEIVNACDAAREGEYIFGLIYQASRSRKPVRRLWTASLTDEGIRSAFAKMKPASAYAGLRDAGYCRSEADWLLGMNGSRAQTLFLRGRGVRTKGAAPIGRVQTPVLNLLYRRRKEIDTFVPEDFWTVLADFQAEAGAYTGKWFWVKAGKQQDRLRREADADRLIALLSGKPARVVGVEQKDVRKPSELLYDLTTLQREANKRYGLSAEKTLQAAQALYETHKVLSYPRTDSRHIGPSEEKEDLPRILEALAGQPEYAEHVGRIRASGRDRKPLGKRYVDASKVGDHTAILPTEKAPGQPLPPAEQKIYDLVVRRTLAMFFPERIEAKSTIYTEVEAEKPQLFKTTGTVCKQEGWSVVDPATKAQRTGSEEGEESGPLPDVRKGDVVEVRKLYSKKGQTTPPKELTEDTLLGAMETAGKQIEDDELKAAMKDGGLGTPATRASIIERLIDLGFARRQKKVIGITEEGIQQIESIEIDLLKSPELTGEWEAKLSRMARGEYERARFMAEIAEFTRTVVASIRARADTAEPLAQGRRTGGGKRRPARGSGKASPWKRTPTDEACPRCKERKLNLVENAGSGVAFHGCPDRECNFTRRIEQTA